MTDRASNDYRLTVKARKRTMLDVDVYTLACERVARLLDDFDGVAVAFSGGKDSTAVLNVTLEVANSDPRFARHLPLRVLHYDEEAIPYETEAYVRRVSQRDDVALEWMCLPFKHRNACSRTNPWWWPWAPEARELWCRPLPPEAITTLKGFPINPPGARLTAPDTNGLFVPPELGNVAMLMGIRGAESRTRAHAVTSVARHGDVNYIKKFDGPTGYGNVFKAYPIYDWRTSDVWTAPARLGWDHNEAYDRMAMMGISPGAQRCSPAFGEEPMQKLHMFAACFPEVWDKMCVRVPGAAAAARYATTELYSFGERPQKPPGMPWPDFVRHYLAKHWPKEAAVVAGKLHQEVYRHYRNTSDPIVVKAFHPLSGVSWDWALRIAMRGDLKSRNPAAYNIQADDLGRPTVGMWRRYAAELDQVLADGTFGELAHPGRPPADAWALVPAYARQDAQETP
jgi:predicted phosphoadenosine phosphosulfate sulfurtransferase